MRLTVVVAPRDVLAAGVVVFRSGHPGKQVLLVHRPKYDDWSFPKGKLDRGEHQCVAAVREVAEETGLHVRLGPPLTSQAYPVSGHNKQVFYWAGRVVGDDDVAGYEPNAEIDQVEWVDYAEAFDRLTYDRDRATLKEAKSAGRKTRSLVVLRHGPARSRATWRAPDPERPLLKTGREQALRLVPLLAAYNVSSVISSPSLRCLETVSPYVETTGFPLQTERRLSEEDVTASGVRRIVDEATSHKASAVICSHRPVLPEIFEALGMADPQLAPGEMFVAHLRQGRATATERHLVR